MSLPMDYGGTAVNMLTVALSGFTGSILAVDVPFPFSGGLISVSKTVRIHSVALVGSKKVSGSSGNGSVSDPVRHHY